MEYGLDNVPHNPICRRNAELNVVDKFVIEKKCIIEEDSGNKCEYLLKIRHTFCACILVNPLFLGCPTAFL